MSRDEKGHFVILRKTSRPQSLLHEMTQIPSPLGSYRVLQKFVTKHAGIYTHAITHDNFLDSPDETSITHFPFHILRRSNTTDEIALKNRSMWSSMASESVSGNRHTNFGLDTDCNYWEVSWFSCVTPRKKSKIGNKHLPSYHFQIIISLYLWHSTVCKTSHWRSC